MLDTKSAPAVTQPGLEKSWDGRKKRQASPPGNGGLMSDLRIRLAKPVSDVLSPLERPLLTAQDGLQIILRSEHFASLLLPVSLPFLSTVFFIFYPFGADRTAFAVHPISINAGAWLEIDVDSARRSGSPDREARQCRVSWPLFTDGLRPMQTNYFVFLALFRFR